MLRGITFGVLLTYAFISVTAIQVNVNRPNRDTYLKALENSHGLDLGRDDYNSAYPTGYDYNPKPVYGAPTPTPSYGPPAPAPSYGPPVYGPPAHAPMMMMYGTPHKHSDNWFLDKFKFKLDIYTIGKIILKLIIFKKIVKFIALLCLLLFLPSLKEKFDHNNGDNGEGGDDDLGRNIRVKDDVMSSFALTAINSFAKKNGKSCQNDNEYYCRFENMIDEIDVLYPYQRIMKMYKPFIIMEPVQEISDNKVKSNNGEIEVSDNV